MYLHTIINDDPTSTSRALANLGLTTESLLEAVKQGFLARINCTANHPPLLPPYLAWGETVRTLREQLAPMGWKRNDDRQYSRVIHPDETIAITVATGNEATGKANDYPVTKSDKGPCTIKAVTNNCSQLSFEGMELPELPNDEPWMTWILLVHYAPDEIRSELSLPSQMGPDGRVNGWSQRIILPSIPHDPDALEMAPPSQPDLNVEIRRKI